MTTGNTDWHYGRMLRHIGRRLTTREGLSRVLRDPGVAARFLRHWIWNANFREESAQDIAERYRISLTALDQLARTYDEPLSEETIGAVFGNELETPDCRDMATLFDRNGSDKSNVHNYHLIYAALLKGRRHERLSILEIGLGTNNIGVRSNMGPEGRPGASVRAFRDWAPKADVHGADVDQSILFHEERITTHWVDQADPVSLTALAQTLAPRKFDLIIDDGLHEPHANLNTIHFALKLLAPGGYLVVEDIQGARLEFWQIAFTILRRAFSCHFLRTRAAYAFVIRAPEAANTR